MEPLSRWLLLSLAAVCTVTPAMATTYYLAPGGDDAGAGTAAQPWATLEHASDVAGPGDTVVLAPGEYPGQLHPQRSGEAEAPIVFRAAERHQAVLTGPENGYAAVLRDVSHIRLEGLAFRPAAAGGTWVIGERAQALEFTNLMMDGCTRSDGLRLMHCADVRLSDCTILNGRSGNMVYISNSERLVFEGCEISGSAHALLLFLPDRTNDRVVIRGCVFAGRTGRTVLIDSVEHLLFENNIIVRSLDGGRSAGARFGFYGTDAIFRGCRVYDNWGAELFPIIPYRETLDLVRVRVYNNVFDGNCSPAVRVRNFEGKYNMDDALFANNVFAGGDPFGSRCQIVISEPDPREEVQFHRNLIDGPVEVLDALGDASDLGNNLAGAPRFADEAVWEHVPAEGSPLIDAGMFLTHALEAGEGTRLHVEDAQWFYDGFGIATERGDVVAVGSADNLARVVGVDYEMDVLEFDRPLRWSAGAPVSLPWAGEGPEIGVFEVGAAWLAPPVVVARPYVAEPGEPVLLEAVTPAPLRDATVEWQLGDGTRLEGPQVRHSFANEGEWGVRVRVRSRDGEIVRGAGFVVVKRPRGADEPLIHSTFDPEDDSAWFIWQTYRPGTTEWGYEQIDGTWALHVKAPQDRLWLPCRTNPREWSIDRDPFITVRYRIGEGTPVGAYVEGFPTHEGTRRIWLAGTSAAMPLPKGANEPQTLLDDNAWHTLKLDARALRALWPDVTTAMRFAFEGQWASARDRVEAGDEFWLDEVTIGPSYAE